MQYNLLACIFFYFSPMIWAATQMEFEDAIAATV